MKHPSRDQLRDARDQFASLIERQAAERDFQKLFTRCPYILSQSLPLRLFPMDILPMGTPGKSEPDFIFFPGSPRSSGQYGVIEIKRPDSIIATLTRKNLVTLSRDAETAIAQSEQYLHDFPNTTLLRPFHTIVLGNRGHIFVVMGLSEQIYPIVADEMLNQQMERRIPANCQLLPYDVLLDKFTKSIGTKVHFLVPALEHQKRVVIMDGGMRNGVRTISEIIADILRYFEHGKGEILVVDHMAAFAKGFKTGSFEFGVIIFNPTIDELPTFWPTVSSSAAYAFTPIVFVYNPDGNDLEGERRTGKYLRPGFDDKETVPFDVPKFMGKVERLLDNRLQALIRLNRVSTSPRGD